MVSIETLTKPTKAPSANIISDEENESSLSFEKFLKGLTLDEDVSKDEVLMISSKNDEKDIKSTLLSLLKPQDTKESKDIKSTLLSLLKPQDIKESKDILNDLLKNDTSLEEDIKNTIDINPELSKNLSTSEVKYLMYKAKQYLKDKITSHPDFKKLDIKELPNNIKSLLNIADKLKIDIKNITYEDIKQLPKEFNTKKNTNLSNQDDILIDDQIQNNIKNTKQQVKTTEQKLEQFKNIELFKENTPKNNQPILTTKEILDTKTKDKKQKNTSKDLLSTLLSKEDTKAEQKSDKSILQTLMSNSISSKTAQNLNHLDDKKETQNQKSAIEELLKPSQNDTKTLHVNKSDSLDVKINESKQMMKYLSQDIKKAIDDYKPPFTRIKVSLNPQKLGEMDLTVVQRGKNVHINLSSNNAALNILTNNLNELKTQLNQNGINNASFSFNSQSQGENPRQQQNQKAYKEYQYAKDDELTEEQNYLEIIIPRYV